jgi:hypothetical protein
LDVDLRLDPKEEEWELNQIRDDRECRAILVEKSANDDVYYGIVMSRIKYHVKRALQRERIYELIVKMRRWRYDRKLKYREKCKKLKNSRKCYPKVFVWKLHQRQSFSFYGMKP